jgi:hypothetical protein
VVHASLRIRPLIHYFALALSFLTGPIGDSLSQAFGSPCRNGSFVGYGFRLRIVLLRASGNQARTSIRACFRALHVLVRPFFCLIFQAALSGLEIRLFWNCVLLALCVWTFLLGHLNILAQYGSRRHIGPVSRVHALPPQSEGDGNKGEIIPVCCKHPRVTCLPEHFQGAVPEREFEACPSVESHLVSCR